ncbi:MAG TPA: sulfite exporter TauE/SafE family protein, partial [Anaeromyxobacteraceae bacterium]
MNAQGARQLPGPDPSIAAVTAAPTPPSAPWRREAATLFVTGVVAGAFGGLVGVGGNVILILFLVGSGKLSQHQAQATSLVALVFTGLAGATRYGLMGAVDLAAAAALALPAILTARPGARYAHTLSEWQLKRVFGGFLLAVSLLLLLKHQLPGLSQPITGGHRMVVLIATGALTGFASGMLGVGGGSLMVPAMVLLAGFGQHVAQGTSLLAMVPAGAAAAHAHWRLGNVAKRLLPPLIPGVLI